MSLPNSSLLCEFLTECQLPETVEIVEGYDSNESAEMSWSSGETVYLHAMKDVPHVLALDRKGNRFCIPLNYPEKIFEGIPNRCSDSYESVRELIVHFPKYVRSLQNIPQSGVKVGDILCLLETSSKDAGCVDLKCKVVGKACSITLSGDQVGLFETLEDIDPITMREITDKHLLPTQVRVRAGAKRFYNPTNLNKVILEGLLTIQETAQEKVLIVYTLYEKDLRVVKVPTDLEIRVRRKTSKLDPKLFTEICRRIDEGVNIDSTITTGSREASWFFDISDTEQDIEAVQPDCYYEEIVPRLPPRSPSKRRTGSTPNQYTKLNKTPDNEARYVPPSELKPLRKSGRDGTPGPPPVAKKPSMYQRNSCHSQLITTSDCPTNTSSRNEVQSHTERKSAEVQSHSNRPEKEGDTKAAKKHQASAFPQGSKKPVSPTLCKQTSNNNTQTPPKEESPNSHQPVQPVDPVAARESIKAPSLPLGKPTPDVTKPKPVEEENSLSSPHTGPLLENPSSRLKKSDSKENATKRKLTSHNVESHKRTVKLAGVSGMTQGQTAKELLEGISVSEVCTWLTKLGLTEHVDRFKDESIDGDFLLELDAEMMLHLGISNPLHRKKLDLFIRKGWTPNKN